MSDVNRVELLGRLARDPHYVVSDGHKKNRTWLVIATGWKRGEQEHTEFINCNLWGVHADNAAKYLKKGDEVRLEGRLSRFSKPLIGDDGQPITIGGKEVYQEQTTVNCHRCDYLRTSRKNMPRGADQGLQETVDAAVQAALASAGLPAEQEVAASTASSDDPFNV